jgi:putative mRNA 3-end processing factor
VGDLLEVTEAGLYCQAGDFYVDPWRAVPRAVITHAHADHARGGCGRYLCLNTCRTVLRERIGNRPIDTLRRGEGVLLGDVRVSLVPAGHILGSAQVRIEHRGQVWCVTGDYKLEPDPTCDPFEPVRCDVLVTESTFGLPVYRWRDPAGTAAEIDDWWRQNRDAGRTSVLFGYSLGKAQRLAALVDPAIGPIYAHGAVMRLVRAYRAAGVRLPPIDQLDREARRAGGGRALVLAPPSAAGGRWLRSFGDAATATASGWMAIRGVRRRRGSERGFVLSDHADFPGLVRAVEESHARRVLVTHGSADSFARFLRERGLDADVLATRFRGESLEAPDPNENDLADEGPADDVVGRDGPAGAADDAAQGLEAIPAIESDAEEPA